MKYILTCLITFCLSLGVKAAQPEIDTHGLSQEDYNALIKAISLVDNGLSQLAQPEFDRIVDKNPKNYFAQYERIFSLCQQQKYEEATASYKKLLKHKDASPLAYHMICVAFQKLGKLKESDKILRDGLKRFPNSGVLYMLDGGNKMQEGQYGSALNAFNKGIQVEPMFWKNYFLASDLLTGTEELKAWSLVYSETAMLLEGDNNKQEFIQMATNIRDCYKNNLTIEPDTVIVHLCPSRDMTFVKNTDLVLLQFPGIYEACTTLALSKLAETDSTFTASIDQLTRLRKGIVENYFGKAQGLYGDAMYLFPFQKAVIDAGHWEAYNYFLFGYLYPEEYSQWLDNNEGKINAFYNWYIDGKFELNSTHTVGMNTIFRDYPDINLVKALMIQAQLLKENLEINNGEELINLLEKCDTVFHGSETSSK